VTDGGGEQLAELSDGQGIYKRAEREWPEVTPSHGRFVMSLLELKQRYVEVPDREVRLPAYGLFLGFDSISKPFDFSERPT